MKKIVVSFLLSLVLSTWANEACPVIDPNNKNLSLYAYDDTIQSLKQINVYQDITVNTNVILNGWQHIPGSAEFQGGSNNPATCCIVVTTTNPNGSSVVLHAVNENGVEIPGSHIAAVLAPNELVSLTTYAGGQFSFQFTGTDLGIKIITPVIGQPSITVTSTY